MTERYFTKTVETIEKDDDEQVAISAVLVPNEVDRQLDFLRPEGVRNLFNPDADIGVMHAVFDNSAATSEHRILEEPETIGGKEYAAGTWIERREYHDDELWSLVKRGVLEGRSIGGEVPEDSEVDYAPGDVPDDVSFPTGVPSDRGATEIVDGSVSEVSDVDLPAVPNAEHAVVKSDLAKDILGNVSGEEEFVGVMRERGHDDADARELWAYLQTHKAVDERAESRAGQDNTKMTEDTDDDGAEPESSETPTEEATKADTGDIDDVDDATLGSRIKSALRLGGGADDDTGSEDPADAGAEKAGRTLSERNQHAVMASVDAQLDLLDDAGVDHGMTRFTDRDDVAFSIEEYGDKGEHSDDKPDKNAPGGDTPDDDMTDDINDKVDALEEKLDTLSEKLDEEDGTEAEKEDEQDDELSEKLDAIAEKVSDLDERVDKMATKTADTEQVGGAEKSAETTDETSAFKAALGGN